MSLVQRNKNFGTIQQKKVLQDLSRKCSAWKVFRQIFKRIGLSVVLTVGRGWGINFLAFNKPTYQILDPPYHKPFSLRSFCLPNSLQDRVKYGGGDRGVGGRGYSLKQGNPTYQILTLYYAQNWLKSLWWVVGGGGGGWWWLRPILVFSFKSRPS